MTKLTTILANPRKRHVLPLCGTSESDSDGSQNGKDNIYSSKIQVEQSDTRDEVSSHLPSLVPRSETDSWRDCVFRTAQNAGFNSETVLKAFLNAPNDQPTVKVLRVLQCICEVANSRLLLQIKTRLQADSATSTSTIAPATVDSGEDICSLVHLHQDINNLRTISWTAQYELALHQLVYYQQFETVVRRRSTEMKKETNERRNRKKRLAIQSTATKLVNALEPLRPVQAHALVKEEIISLMVDRGSSESVAKDDLELYLNRGKTIHLLFGSASVGLLAFFPLYEIEDRQPSLDLLSCISGDVPQSVQKELARPITAS